MIETDTLHLIWKVDYRHVLQHSRVRNAHAYEVNKRPQRRLFTANIGRSEWVGMQPQMKRRVRFEANVGGTVNFGVVCETGNALRHHEVEEVLGGFVLVAVGQLFFSRSG